MNYALKSSFAIEATTAAKFLKRAGDTAINLRVTEKILNEVERRLFLPEQTQFDIDFVRKNLQNLKSLPGETPSEKFLQVEFSLDQEFNLWRGLLEDRDRKIETYHLRRFFDASNQSFDPAIFVALGYFYRSSASYISHLSKFDLVITRLYSAGPPTHREPRLTRRERTIELAGMFADWEGEPKPDPTTLPVHQDAVSRLDEFIFEAETLVDFEDLVRSNIFDRLRTFKRELGAVFFEADVVSVAIEVNLVLGNIFNELLTRANQNLGEKLNASFDFAGAFHDTSVSTRAHLSEILGEIRSEVERIDPRSDDRDVAHIWELLGMVCGEVPANREAESYEPVVLPMTASDRLSALLVTLEEPEPDVRMLREYTQRSKSLWTIDLNDFIRNDEPELDRLCRDVLRVILLTDELCTHELTKKQDITQETFDELSVVFRRSIELGETLEALLERYSGSLQNRLLVVSNKFLETRLRLERTIVRYSNHHLGLLKQEEPAPPVVVQTEKPATAATTATKRPVNRWLMVMTFVIAFLCGGVWFAAQQLEGSVPAAQDLEELNVASLPASEHLAAAYRHKGTVYVVTKGSWDQLGENERRAAVENIARIPAKFPVDNVVVTSTEGRPVAEFSDGGVNLNPGL